MGFIYHFGLRPIVLEDAPVLNGNAIEDAIIGIQAKINMPEFKARELFYPNEQTCGGSSDAVFACQWIGCTAQVNLRQLPPDLAQQFEMIMSESWSEPYSVELPGTCDILVPSLPMIDESPMMNHLKYTQELPSYASSPHLKVFGKEKITLGSLNAEIEVIEIQLRENLFDEEASAGINRVLDKLKIAQQHNLFVTFRY